MRRLFSRAKPPKVDREFVLGRMSRPPFHRIRLERCPRGIDGVRVDVALDQQLVNATILLVKGVLRRDVQHYFWRQAPKALESDIVGGFQKAYMDHSRMVLQQVRSSARPEMPQLFQLAVLRLILMVVDQQFGLLRQELYDARALPARQHGGQSLELHDKAVALARNEGSIRFRTLQGVLRIVIRMEDSLLRKQRETILGMSWPVPRSMLVNPLLLLGGQGSSEDFFQFYPHVLRDRAHAETLTRSLFEVLSDWLPDELVLASGSEKKGELEALTRGYALRGQLEVEEQLAGLVEQGELAQMIPHEFDNAGDILALLGGDSELWPEAGLWERDDFSLVQRAKVREWMATADKADLMTRVTASYRLNAIYPLLGIRGGADWVYDYLTGASSARELMRRLRSLPGVGDARGVVRLIDEKANSGEAKDQRHADERTAVRFASDLVRYRYDLKLACWLYRGLAGLRLLHDQEKLTMSASNGLLQDFRHGRLGNTQTVIGHVVLKADVRGSTDITNQMQARNLNPATYFSRTLYDPISNLLGVFGAEKVFVEGDAVILSLMEYEGDQVDQLAVARACGLAQRILQVVEAKNRESRELGLPELGLGIGIAYLNMPPTYLYDDDHRIMISSAINRADRLSSCHKSLRKLLSQAGNAHRPVVVAQPVMERGGYAKSDSEGLLHYNVRGIELDADSFDQLQMEITLTPVELPGEQRHPADIYHVGRYIDTQADTHWLVIRESPVLLWMAGRLVEGERGDRVYYEVVCDRDLIDRVTQNFRGQE